MARIEVLEIQKAELSGSSCGSDMLFQLGLMYSTGMDEEPDLVSAHKWFNLAAMKGNQAARDYRREIALEMSPGEIAEAQRLAREWLYGN